jgi:hypothetical protein
MMRPPKHRDTGPTQATETVHENPPTRIDPQSLVRTMMGLVCRAKSPLVCGNKSSGMQFLYAAPSHYTHLQESRHL